MSVSKHEHQSSRERLLEVLGREEVKVAQVLAVAEALSDDLTVALRVCEAARAWATAPLGDLHVAHELLAALDAWELSR